MSIESLVNELVTFTVTLRGVIGGNLPSRKAFSREVDTFFSGLPEEITRLANTYHRYYLSCTHGIEHHYADISADHTQDKRAAFLARGVNPLSLLNEREDLGNALRGVILQSALYADLSRGVEFGAQSSSFWPVGEEPNKAKYDFKKAPLLRQLAHCIELTLWICALISLSKPEYEKTQRLIEKAYRQQKGDLNSDMSELPDSWEEYVKLFAGSEPADSLKYRTVFHVMPAYDKFIGQLQTELLKAVKDLENKVSKKHSKQGQAIEAYFSNLILEVTCYVTQATEAPLERKISSPLPPPPPSNGQDGSEAGSPLPPPPPVEKGSPPLPPTPTAAHVMRRSLFFTEAVGADDAKLSLPKLPDSPELPPAPAANHLTSGENLRSRANSHDSKAQQDGKANDKAKKKIKPPPPAPVGRRGTTAPSQGAGWD